MRSTLFTPSSVSGFSTDMAAQQTDIGRETLRRMGAVAHYNDWVMERIIPLTGDNVLEVGSGIGNISRYFLDKKQLILTDIRNDYIEHLNTVFGARDNVAVERYDLEGSGNHLAGRNIDTVIALNVLEHIDNDIGALTEMAKILTPGGKVILQLPAHRLLYGTLDKHLDHFRRYTAREIRGKFDRCGFRTAACFRMNMPGALGWLLYSRILRHDILPEGPLGLFNRLTPAFMTFEKIIPAPFGLSIVAVGEKI